VLPPDGVDGVAAGPPPAGAHALISKSTPNNMHTVRVVISLPSRRYLAREHSARSQASVW